MNHNDSSEYNKLPDNIQKEVCEHFQDKYYPESSLEDIHNAFVDIDPVVKDIEDKSFTVWEAHRASFEKRLGINT